MTVPPGRVRRSIPGVLNWMICWPTILGIPGRERLTLVRVYEELRNQGYDGSYDAVRRYAASLTCPNLRATFR